MRFVVTHDLPLSIGESPYFRNFTKTLNPKLDYTWNAVSTHSLIRTAYLLANEAIREKLKSASAASIAITSEGTMYVGHVSYQIVTGQKP
jgi:hypothetical protein